MKKSLIITAFFLMVSISFLEAQKLPGVDKSPLDMAYMPHNYSHDGGDGPFARVIYSRPAKKEREVFGKLVPYGKMWRVGANEATEVEFFEDATVNGVEIKAGTYSLFIIPGEKEWEFVFSNMQHTWGAYSYDEEKDALRTKVKVSQGKKEVENLTIMFASEGKSGKMVIYWDKTVVELPISF